MSEADMDAMLDEVFDKVLGYVPGPDTRPTEHKGKPRLYDHEAIRRMAREGMPHKVIAAEVGCTMATVSDVCRKAGIYRHRPKQEKGPATRGSALKRKGPE